MLYMSGTPVNNPQEIYDLCNLIHDDNLKTFSDKQARQNEIKAMFSTN